MPKKPIGFSTGTFYKFLNPIDMESPIFVRKLDCNAIEINWHHADSWPPKNIGKMLNGQFQSTSLHLPVDMSDSGGIFKTMEILNRASIFFTQCHSFRYAVIHPHLITSWDDFYLMFNHNISLPLAIENMDNRKKSFQDLPSLLEFFKKYPAIGLVFDVNHWIVNGNNINSISETIERIIWGGVKLFGIHLSGLGFHEPLFKTPGGEEIVKSLQLLPPDIPIIIESIFENRDEPAVELAFVRKYLEI